MTDAEAPPGYTEAMELPEKSPNGVDPAQVEVKETMTQRQIIKNLLVVSVGFLFLFTAFQSMGNLQSSLNREANVGTGSLAIVYGALVRPCL